MSLVIIDGCQRQSTDEEVNLPVTNGLKYDFDAEDIHIGDGTGMSMVELGPRLITEISGDFSSSLLRTGLSQSTSILSREMSNEESLKEYADLKFSLLLYDAILIFAGAWITDISTGEKATLAFLTGGAVGFLYLLLLQRSVDGLPAPQSISAKKDGENSNELLEGLKGPVSRLPLALGFAFAVVKFGPEIASVALTPKEILIGMAGFLVCKVAVVLAAFKSMPMRSK